MGRTYIWRDPQLVSRPTAATDTWRDPPGDGLLPVSRKRVLVTRRSVNAGCTRIVLTGSPVGGYPGGTTQAETGGQAAMVAAGGPGPFGCLLQRQRLAAGLSQEELAERAGLSRRGISDLERGVRRSPLPATA